MSYLFNEHEESALSYVHPVQVKHIKNLLNCGLPPQINYVILFGGSVSLTCHPYSDLDLYLLGEEDVDVYELRSYFSSIRKQVGKPIDILYSTLRDFLEDRKVLGSVECRAWEEGVVIYAKEAENPYKPSSVFPPKE